MKKIILTSAIITIMFASAPAQGNWEIDIHYSTWSINIIKSIIEENISPEFENYDPDKQSFTFDSNGSNYGLAIRYFPKGKNGSFSIGFSYERNNFSADIKGSYSDTDDEGYRRNITGKGTFELLPHSVNLNLRWELWPTHRVHPFIGFAFGIGPTKGSITLNGSVEYPGGEEENSTYNESMTIEEAMAEGDDETSLAIIPIVHFFVGVRGEVVKNLYLLGEFGLYNGIIFRGGLAYRF